MASMLASQPTRLEGQWEYIQNSLATNNFARNSNYEDMMYILDLSYKHLPRHLKSCFLYLGCYPEDYEIRKVQLVRRWVAEGFVSNPTGQNVWDVAECYFNELINRSMIQPTYDVCNNVVWSCKVHDMLLELIARRCKEDNFLSLVNGPLVAEEVQDKVIRRLIVVGLQVIMVDCEVTITNNVNLSQIRSVTMQDGSNWMPSLLELKFVRVLSLDLSLFGRREMVVDLTIINQLLQLRYLEVKGDGRYIKLPCQLRGLRLLETLDLSRLFNHMISLEIVDAPHLSHLLMPMDLILPDWIDELTSLSDLELSFPKGRAGLCNATWMAALSTSLAKLGNLKRLDLTCSFRNNVTLCADALSSFSPNLEVLFVEACTFSRVPKWIGHLRNIRNLSVRVRQVLQEDVAIIGTRLPSLVFLRLRIPGVPAERIIIQDSTGFPALKKFLFNCDGMSFLTFGAGAMPQLRVLEVALDADEWDKAAPGGLQHLPSLENIQVLTVRYLTKRQRRTNEGDVEALMRNVFQEAVDALHTRPTFFYGTPMFRHVEEDDYVEEED